MQQKLKARSENSISMLIAYIVNNIVDYLKNS